MKIAIAGADIMSGAGFDLNQTYQSVLSSKSAVDAEGYAALTPEVWDMLQARAPREFAKGRCLSWGHFLLNRCFESVDWLTDSARLQSPRTGIVFASTTSRMDEWEKDLPGISQKGLTLEDHLRLVEAQSLGSPLLYWREFYKMTGPHTVIASSCSASLQALAVASLWIENGLVDRCVVVTTEILSQLTTFGFQALRLLSKQNCRPFAPGREGINLGEGAAVVLLERQDLNQSGIGFVTGVGLNMDAYHPTAPEPRGEGSLRAMEAALKMGGHRSITDIDWIYTHGTGSLANDAAEVHALMGLGIDKGAPVTSTKSIHGHCLGASGLLEAVLGLRAMKEQTILPTYQGSNSWQIDKTFERLSFNKEPKMGVPIRNYIKNSLGFGGMNAAILFELN